MDITTLYSTDNNNNIRTNVFECHDVNSSITIDQMTNDA